MGFAIYTGRAIFTNNLYEKVYIEGNSNHLKYKKMKVRHHSLGFFIGENGWQKNKYALLLERGSIWKGVGTTEKTDIDTFHEYIQELHESMKRLPGTFKKRILAMEKKKKRSIHEKLLILAFLKKTRLYPLKFYSVYEGDTGVLRKVFKVRSVMESEGKIIENPTSLEVHHLIAMRNKEEFITGASVHIESDVLTLLYQHDNPFSIPYIGFKKALRK